MNIDLIIVGVFLVITLSVGLYYGRGTNTFKDYAVGSSTMPPWAITVSLIATLSTGPFGNIFSYPSWVFLRKSPKLVLSFQVNPLHKI